MYENGNMRNRVFTPSPCGVGAKIAFSKHVFFQVSFNEISLNRKRKFPSWGMGGSRIGNVHV